MSPIGDVPIERAGAETRDMERSPLSKDAEHMLEGHFPCSHGDISILRQGLPPATALLVESYRERRVKAS